MSFMSTISSDPPTLFLCHLCSKKMEIAPGTDWPEKEESSHQTTWQTLGSFSAILARQISQKAQEKRSKEQADAPTSMQYNLETRITEIKIMSLEYFSVGNLHKKTVTRAKELRPEKWPQDWTFFRGVLDGMRVSGVFGARA